VARLAAAFGRPLMPWQAYTADVALEVDADGRFCYKLVIVTVPRQSGKSVLDGAVMSHRALILPRGRVWFTFQSQKDAVDWLVNEFWPLLSPLGSEVSLRRQAGSENLRWRRSNGLVRPFPPTESGLHSKISDLVVIDEAWKFDLVSGRGLDGAIVPTQATRPNAQVVKVSTAGTARSTWWLGAVEQGRAAVSADRDSGVAYFEWSCPDRLDPCDPESWPLYHPAYGRTIGAPAMQAALEQLGPDEFARAYGNRWVSTTSRVIPLDAWRRAAEEPADLPGPGRVALAFDVAVDRADAACVAAWRSEDGVGHVEVADHRDGVSWLPGRLSELCERWRPTAVAYDAAGPALDVADVAARAGVEVVGLKAREYAAACAGLLDGLCQDPPAVRYRPHPALDAAANDAVRRALGDAWAWGRRQSAGSVSALTAATVALWAFDHGERVVLGEFRVY
jgi:phage terminase large subunit-like protein